MSFLTPKMPALPPVQPPPEPPSTELSEAEKDICRAPAGALQISSF